MIDGSTLAIFAAHGRQVAVISGRQEQSNAIGDAISAAGQADIHRWFKANGAERIEFKNGGRVHLLSRRGVDRLRGRRLDLVVVDDHRYLQDTRFMETIMPCFASNPGGRPRIGVLVS
ncbi:hypothetical protein Leucomu_03560 [Leucobacter muris]|uniref:Uncharacterized protein n=1 Tax=Leucobacter muris TaxID=1935379 RepID=A0ABX5QDH8_9MICO|nr:hypothetical protein [Leucobacter muris]QAB17119.1 hypothetical protein Leucomu_03560 [Leucobacter muris]